MEPAARIVELEAALAYQERRVEELDEVVQSLGRSVDQLRQRVAALEARRSLAEGSEQTSEPPPPHY